LWRQLFVCVLAAGIADFLANCVDRYIALQIQAQDGFAASSKDKDQDMLQYDERLEAVVERMFERCIEDKQYEQVYTGLCEVS